MDAGDVDDRHERPPRSSACGWRLRWRVESGDNHGSPAALLRLCSSTGALRATATGQGLPRRILRSEPAVVAGVVLPVGRRALAHRSDASPRPLTLTAPGGRPRRRARSASAQGCRARRGLATPSSPYPAGDRTEARRGVLARSGGPEAAHRTSARAVASRDRWRRQGVGRDSTGTGTQSLTSLTRRIPGIAGGRGVRYRGGTSALTRVRAPAVVPVPG